jgi:hypothetical protein
MEKTMTESNPGNVEKTPWHIWVVVIVMSVASVTFAGEAEQYDDMTVVIFHFKIPLEK